MYSVVIKTAEWVVEHKETGRHTILLVSRLLL